MKNTFNKGLILTSLGSFWWGFIGVIYFESVSFIGHTECASGVIGMMQPLENLSAANTEKVLHLTTINPHVISVMKSTTSIDIKSPVVRLGRQVAGNSLAACSGDAVCGVGSFAFQGTNGHAVLSAEIKASSGSRAVPGVRTIFHLFNKFRHWVLPASHASLRSFDAFRKMRPINAVRRVTPILQVRLM